MRGASRKAGARAAEAPAAVTDAVIVNMGNAGDGATASGQHVPFTLPGETVRIAEGAGGRAALLGIISASDERVQPPCPHFGVCGGCALQHWADAPYAAWKSGLVRQALARAGFADPIMSPLARTPPAARRRIEFAAARSAEGMRLGLHQARSNLITDIAVCHVVDPRIGALIAPLRSVLASLSGLRKRGDVAVNLLDGGAVDVLIRADAPASPQDRARLAAFAEAVGAARVSWSVGREAPEVAAQRDLPSIAFGGVRISPPPGAFLQASREGEDAITAAVLAGVPEKLGSKALIFELYAGVGTLSFPLAARARVRAFEGDDASFAALRRAAGGTRVEPVHRDLARQPLQPAELKSADCVVLDPPFSGAAAQMGSLAASGLPVIYVSCNPQALARDAAVLHGAGYRLAAATPIDQFLWSAQVEAVCVFVK